jgi:Holliday junction resolvase RusA-like endonuclease
VIRVDVLGTPKPKGSLRPITTPTGRTFLKESRGHALQTWREQLSAAFQTIAEGRNELIPSPVAVFCHFRFAPPKKRVWPWPIAKRRNDIDKLCRTVLDHLSGVLIEDDAQVALLVGTKRFDAQPGAEVVIEELSHGNGSRVDLGTLALEAANVLLGGDAEDISPR